MPLDDFVCDFCPVQHRLRACIHFECGHKVYMCCLARWSYTSLELTCPQCEDPDTVMSCLWIHSSE